MSAGNAISSRVLQLLMDRGLITAEQLASVVDAAASSGVTAGVVLAERGLIDAQDIADVLEAEMGVPHVDLASYAPEERALTLVPAYLARECRVLPLFEIEGMLTVAVSDAMDVFGLDRVAAQVGLEVEPVLSEAAALSAALEHYYSEDSGGFAGGDSGWSSLAPEPEYEAAEIVAEVVGGSVASDSPSASADAPWTAPTPDGFDITDEYGPSAFAGDESGPKDAEPGAWSSQAAAAETTSGEDTLGPGDEEHAWESQGESWGIHREETVAFGEYDAGEPPVDESGSAAEEEVSGLVEEAPEPAQVPSAPGGDTFETLPSAEEPAAAGEAASGEAEHPQMGLAAPGSPSIDLEVLAVADARNVAVLVSDILEDAVARDASRIHLLPYKDDFFLVYRLDKGLERMGTAPLSMQAALVEGFKIYARLGGVDASKPAFGRVRAHIRERDLVLTVSVVPTVAGQRLVVSLAPFKPAPRDLGGLGASEAESRALRAMVERGRGILLVCAPVAGGSSTTYYALLAHAAAAGKTVYSVERSVEHEIPAVAQVMVQPGGPAPAAYIAAGMRQDTDVIAVDGLRSVEDVHLAVEAASHGKLVIVTYAAGDIAAGVHRMLTLGVEPHSLAAALALGVGQRLVRLNCRNCAQQTDGSLARRIPDAPPNITDIAGSGCPNCGKTGFRGVVGLFEVLPFTEPVRATIARGATEAEIAQAAADAGMRPLLASGLARVRAGDVSAEELNRVLRFAE